MGDGVVDNSPVKDLFIEALDLPPEQRGGFLERRCAGDAEVRDEVQALLDAHASAVGFLGDGEGDPAVTDTPSAPDPNELGNVGPYKLLQVIGEGGFGTVYLAEQQHPVRRRVALKVIKLGMDTKQVIARFEAERQALAMMDHPSIARVYDAGATDTGRPYFVMELVNGVRVTQHCDANRLTMRQRLELFIRICQAVQHAHQKGIIHRDLKPSNVLVTMHDGTPVPKIIDFGIAKATQARLTERTLFTDLKQMIGTPEYMSPEQAEVGPLDIDTRTDVYSLGVLLYELLTGSTPFDARELRSKAFGEMQRMIREVDPPKPSTRLSTLKATRARVAAQRGIDPSKLTAAVRGELDWIIVKCLEKDRARRYESAGSLAADLLRHLRHEPVTAAAPSRAYRLRKFARRNRLGLTAAAMVVLALCGGVAGVAWFAIDARRQATRAIAAEHLAQQRLVAVDEQRREADERRIEAEAANDDAKAVNEFLTADVLGAANPAVHLGKDLTVKEALDVAAAKVGQKFKDRPRIEATVRNEMALTYWAAGRADLGLPHAREAMEIRRGLLGAAHLDTLESVSNYALLLTMLGRFAEAEPLYRDALETSQRLVGDEHRTTILLLHNLAHLFREQGKHAEAETHYRQALEGQRRAFGQEHADTLTCLDNLGTVLQLQQKLSEAEPLLREALATRRRVHGEEHPKTLLSMNSLALLLHSQGKLNESAKLFRDALEKQRRILGPQHPDTLTSLSNLGRVLQSQGRLAEVEQVFRETLANAQERLGDEHPSTLTFKHNLARLLDQQDRFAEAERLYRELLPAQRRVLGDDNPKVLTTMHNLGLVLSHQGELGESEALLRDSAERKRRAFGDDHRSTLRTVKELGSMLRRHGRFADAEPLLREALERRRRVFGEEDPDTLNSLNDLGYLLKDVQSFGEAEVLLREAFQKRRHVLGDDHADTIMSMSNLGLLFQDQGRLNDAEQLLREALEKRRRVLGEDHPHTLSSLSNLGDLLREQGRLHEAEPMLYEAVEKSRRLLGDPHEDTLISIRKLAALLQAEGKYEQAEGLLLEAEGASSAPSIPLPTRRRILEGLVALYEGWEPHAPGMAYDRKAAEWRAKLATTASAPAPATNPSR